jgi:hypothetical protein
MRRFCHVCVLALLGILFQAGGPVRGQTNLSLYTDHLVNGFQDWSWAAHNLANRSPVYGGWSNSISVSDAAWTGVSFYNAGFNRYQGGMDVSGYTNFSFWANGGASGGQVLQLYVQSGAASGPDYVLPPFPTNAWTQYVVPLSALGVAGVTNVNRFNLQLTPFGASTLNPFYLDDLQLTTSPGPAVVKVALNAGQPLRTADARWFGVNTAVWDGDLDTPPTVGLLQEAGTTLVRFPGGSLSDQYDWATGTSLTNTWEWAASFADFVNLVTKAGVQAIITVNYGTGTPAEAAAWVGCANVTNHLGVKYWEIGNEVYGAWETDSNALPHDPYTYAVRAQQYLQQMKAADPTIKIGVAAAPGEDSYVNYTTHPATNSLTGRVHYGWTAVMLSTLKSLGAAPDFLIDHHYPEFSAADSPAAADCDALLLQSSAAWAGDAADLREQISAYFGAGGTNLEILATENNSDSGAQGRQSTSLVNALYYADSLGRLMQTEINACLWWDLRNGSDTSGSFDATLYGWRTNGDLGMTGGSTNRYPPFYAAKLMQHFAQGGDTILAATSDFALLAAHASRHTNGSVSLLIINKDPDAAQTAQISLTGFAPGTNATVYSFGIPQDDAAQTGIGSPDVWQTNLVVAGTNFSHAFPPYSLTLWTFPPAPPKLQARASPGQQVILQVQGQPNVRYVLQSSTNLLSGAWVATATNTLAGSTWDVTNPIPASPPATFWRTVWLP